MSLVIWLGFNFSLTFIRYWSLYLGRPTALREADIAPACLVKDFGPLISCRLSDYVKKPATRVYEALLQLMDLVTPLCDFGAKRVAGSTEAYLKVAVVDRELNSWYSNLTPDLRWSAENAGSMSATFHLLQ